MMMERMISAIPYGALPLQFGDLRLPERQNAPGVLLIHGGGWGAMDRSAMNGVAVFLQESGFAVFNIDYRLVPAGCWPICGADCRAALDFMGNGCGISPAPFDRTRLAVVGASAGGHLALMTALRARPGMVRCAASISGITDLSLYRRNAPDCMMRLFGRAATADEAWAASPMALIASEMPPVLLTHCSEDNVVDVENARAFNRAALAARGTVAYLEYRRPREAAQSHCIWIPDSQPHRLYPEIETALVRFLNRYCN